MSLPKKDPLKEANALIDHAEQARGVASEGEEICEVSFDIEDWQSFAADIVALVKRAQEADKE